MQARGSRPVRAAPDASTPSAGSSDMPTPGPARSVFNAYGAPVALGTAFGSSESAVGLTP
jgi:hypothetical protein